jgi:DNA-directed RNA polymerase specialized sigma24 family protein
MIDALPFDDLIRRLQAGDDQAATALVQDFEPAMRGAVQAWLIGSPWRRLLHPQDICQIVWAHFFQRLRTAQFQLDGPGRLAQLLKVMARNHLAKEIDRLRARRRGGHLTQQFEACEQFFIDPRPDPSQTVMSDEFLRRLRSLLSADEWRLAEYRAGGRKWADIAVEFGETADTLRVRIARAGRRVARHLCLDASRR